MCLDDCDARPSRRQVVIGGAAALATAACSRNGSPAKVVVTEPPVFDARPATVTAEEITFPNGSLTVPAMVFRPAQEAAAPAVMVGDGNPGFAPWLIDLCKRIAGRGFVAMYVDWMTPQFPPFPADKADEPGWRKQAGSATTWYTGASHFGAGVDWMRERKVATGEAPAAVGFCGGGVVLTHHAARAASLRTLVLFYANARISTSFANPDDPLPDLVDIADKIEVPIQGHYGLHDPTAKPDDSREFERRLVAAGRKPAFHYYADAGHGFMKSTEPLEADKSWGYVEAAAIEAERRMFERFEAR